MPELCEMKNPVGRPKKYGETMMVRQIYIPESVKEMIEDKILDNKFNNFNEAVVAMLTSADVELASNLIQILEEQRKTLLELSVKCKESSELLSKLSDNSNIFRLYKKINTDNYITKIVNDIKKEYMEKLKEKRPDQILILRDAHVRIIKGKLEKILSVEKMYIGNHKIVESIIRTELLKIEQEVIN